MGQLAGEGQHLLGLVEGLVQLLLLPNFRKCLARLLMRRSIIKRLKNSRRLLLVEVGQASSIIITSPKVPQQHLGLVGGGKFIIACTLRGRGVMPLALTWYPKNVRESAPKTHFLRDIASPFSDSRLNSSCSSALCSSSFLDHSSISSRYTKTKSRSCRIESMSL